MDDDLLIRKIAAGDYDAFEELVDRHEASVINICYRLLGNREDAEDVAQEVFLKVWTRAGEFRHGAKFSTWLYRVTVNGSYDFIRHKKRSVQDNSVSTLPEAQQEGVTDPPAPESSRPDVRLEGKETELQIQKAIDSLPKRQRAAFVLHKHEGLTHQQVAEILECSTGSVESLIHRAKRRLLKKLLSSVGME